MRKLLWQHSTRASRFPVEALCSHYLAFWAGQVLSRRGNCPVDSSRRKKEPGLLLTLLCSRYLSSRRSDGSAACGRSSDLSEWQRSAENKLASSSVVFAEHRNIARQVLSRRGAVRWKVPGAKKESGSLLTLLCSRYLSSRAVARQVLSAYMCLTSVFEMGTGGPT